MKKQHSSVVRRGTVPESVGKPLVPPLSPSAVYYYEDADQLQSVYDGHEKGFAYAREGRPNATRTPKPCLTNSHGWKAPMQAL
jgi:cystathionine gamma-synthase